ncbi:hypothetical protein [Microcoleus sp. D3_18a_C4]|uniref:hypothetical protein n=1 Tax=Microcoleus sp. D3_18a_C4 TaxID=3055332 RepID=UPI002FD47D7B
MFHHSQEQAFRPVPQENSSLVEQAEKPVPKKVIENGAISQLELRCFTILKNRQDACSTKNKFYCGESQNFQSQPTCSIS